MSDAKKRETPKKAEAPIKKRAAGLGVLDGEDRRLAVGAYRATEGKKGDPRSIDAWLASSDAKRAIADYAAGGFEVVK